MGRVCVGSWNGLLSRIWIIHKRSHVLCLLPDTLEGGDGRKLHTVHLLKTGLAIRRWWGWHKNGPGVGQILQEFGSVTLEAKQLTAEGDLGLILSTIHFDKLCSPTYTHLALSFLYPSLGAYWRLNPGSHTYQSTALALSCTHSKRCTLYMKVGSYKPASCHPSAPLIMNMTVLAVS